MGVTHDDSRSWFPVGERTLPESVPSLRERVRSLESVPVYRAHPRFSTAVITRTLECAPRDDRSAEAWMRLLKQRTLSGVRPPGE